MIDREGGVPAVRVHVAHRLRGMALACAGALAVAGCGAEAVPSASPTPSPTPTPAPTATALPGSPLAADYRPEGAWTVAFARPGDIVREVYEIALTCPSGTCDAIVRISDDAGVEIGKGTFDLVEGRYVHSSTTSRTVDCTVGARTVPRGATEVVETALVVATYRITGTAREQQAIQGSRTITLEPVPGSACAPSVTVYPATGERTGDLR